MLWLLTLHIAALVAWCGLLLYLPALVAAAGDTTAEPAALAREPIVLARSLFIVAATPSALVAIASGTALFLVGEIVGTWLIFKLTAVSGMAACHVACSALIMRRERQPAARIAGASRALAALAAIFMAAVLWLVLAKPFD